MQDNPTHHQSIQAPPSLLTQVLGRIQQAEQIAQVRPLFVTAFTSPDWTRRVAAVEQLAHAEREMALSWLARALFDTHPSVRARAVHILSQHQAPELIRPSLQDSDWQVREIALLALGMQAELATPEFLPPTHSDPATPINQLRRETSRQDPLPLIYLEGKSAMRSSDQSSPQALSALSTRPLLQGERENHTALSLLQPLEKRSVQRKRLPRLFTLVAALLVSMVLIGGMLLAFSRMLNTTTGTPGSTTKSWNACDDDANMADATLCAMHQETNINITRTFGTQKVTFIRAYADTTQLMLVYTDGLASTDAVSFESVTIQQGIVLKDSIVNGGYSNPTTHQGYNAISFATSGVPAGTTALHVQSIVDVLSGKSTPLAFTVPFHSEQKTILVNQTSTSKGISLTLKQVVFSGSTTLFYVGPEPYANGGYVSLFIQSLSINGLTLTYHGSQARNTTDGHALVILALNMYLSQSGTWTIQIYGDQQGVSQTWTWTFHFTMPDTTK